MGSHMRRSVALMITGLLLCHLAACSANAREKALKHSFTALNAARDGFVQWDKQKQMSIVEAAKTKAEGKENLRAYHKRRQPVIEAFTVAYAALAIAAIDDNATRLTEALKAAVAVYQLVRAITDGDVKTPDGDERPK